MIGALPDLGLREVLVGATTGDDAAVYRIAEDRALVATVDFFTPVVDGAADFGAIAAANSLSDVYAMGAAPLFALSLVAFPRDLLASGALEQMVAAGAAKLAEVRVPVVGGHSIDDAEPKFGYAVIGEVDPARMITHRGARAGDRLYLTKPLGSGIVATAIKAGRCPPPLETAAITVMSGLNRDAARAMLAGGASAATDVTGFGLIGHLRNLVAGAEISLSSVPLMEGVRDLAEAGHYPGGTRRNHAAHAGLVDWNGIAETDQLILCDAQTSGGLLIAIPEDRGPGFEAALAGTGQAAAWIGRVTDRTRISVVR